uniref:BPTI/Kunitz inhibitor domain-containing protein n=1 Tax=Crocodylus porosus TaxID=8502 RepID=A0A7M4ELU5_CROPO
MTARSIFLLPWLLVLCLQPAPAQEEAGEQEPASSRALPAAVCKLQSDPGLCKALVPRWFHNPQARKCESFNYGGCGGNGNNFKTEEACLRLCQGTGEHRGAAGVLGPAVQPAPCSPRAPGPGPGAGQC